MKGFLRHGLLGIFLVLAIGLVVVVSRHTPEEPSAPPLVTEEEPIIQAEADLVLQEVDYTETREGRRQWNLKADSAAYDQETGETLAQNVRMTFFDKAEQDQFFLTANEGRMEEKTGQIEVWGQVVIQSRSGEELRTERLAYDSRQEVASTDQPVDIRMSGKRVNGVGMIYDLNQDRIQLNKQVRALLTGDLRLGK